MIDFEQEEFYEAEDHQGEDNWLGGAASGDDQTASDEPSNHVGEAEVQQAYQWQDGNPPKVEDFTTIEEYQAAEREYQSRPPVPWRDDQDQAQRDELDSWMRKCCIEETIARDRGDSQAAREWGERARMAANELQALGPTEQQQFMEAAGRGQLEGAIDLLCDPANIGNSMWNSHRMQHDSAIIVDRHNRQSQGKIVLPAEDEAFGRVSSAAPGNMIVFELSPEQVEAFQEMVYHCGHENDLDSVFRRSWDHLRTAGLDAEGRRVERPQQNPTNAGRGPDGRFVSSVVTGATPPIKPTDSTVVITKDPNKMTQAEYEAWRKAGGR